MIIFKIPEIKFGKVNFCGYSIEKNNHKIIISPQGKINESYITETSVVLITHQHELNNYFYRLAENSRCKILAPFKLLPYLSNYNFKLIYRDGEIYNNIYAIATPGHTPESTCYLLKHDSLNYLFTGDTLYLCHNEIHYDIKNGNKEMLLASLLKLKKLNIDFLFSSVYVGQDCFLKIKSTEHWSYIIDNCIERLKKGNLN